MSEPFNPEPAIERALNRISDLLYPMSDLVRARAQGQEEPIIEADAAALARRIADEEIDRARAEQGFDVPGL